MIAQATLSTRRFFHWLADAYFGPAVVVAALLIGTAAVAYAWGGLRGHASYPDLVAGPLALTDGDKAIDALALAVLGVTTVVMAVGFGRVFRRLAPGGPASDVGAALNQLLLLSLAPVAWRLTIAALSPVNELPAIRLMAALPLAVLGMAVALGRYQRTDDGPADGAMPETSGRQYTEEPVDTSPNSSASLSAGVTAADVLTCGGAAILSASFAAFTISALTVSLTRLVPRLGMAIFVSRAVGPAMAAVVILAVVGVVVTWAASADVEQFRRRLLRGLVLWQLPLPLLLFYLVPPPLIDPTHRYATPYPIALVAVLAACAGLCGWAVWRRLRQEGQTLSWAVAPATIVALLVYCHCPTATAPLAYRDYFHWGEQVLPWQQLWSFHSRPYVDFVPIHGLMAYLRGGMNQLFFGGTAATYTASDALLAGLASVAAGLCGCWLLGPVAALALVFVPAPGLDRLFLLAPAMYIAAAPATWRRPGRGLVAWLLTCAVMAAYNGAIGPAFTAGTAPIALWAAARAGWRRCLAIAAGVVVIGALGAAIGPVRQTAVGFEQFVVQNGWTNTTANDLPWSKGAWQREEHVGTGSSQLLWEVQRMAWIPVALVGAVLAWRAMGRPAASRHGGLVPLAVATALVLTCAAPWTMGRIDPGAMSRPGAISVTAVGFLLVPLLLLAAPTGRTAVVLAVVLGMVYPSAVTSMDPLLMTAMTYSVRVVPAEVPMIDGAKVGLPNLGQVEAPAPNWVADVAQLHRDLGQVLRPGETYLDLTDQQALYYYMGMPVPVRYASYVAANSRLQAGEERQLAQRPVPAVLVGPASGLDGVPVSLRCYRLYRDYVTRFVPVTMGQFTFLVDPTRAAALPPAVAPSYIRVLGSPTGPPDEARLRADDTLFSPVNLLRIPIAWGRSWPALQHLFTTVAAASVTQPGAGHAWADAAVPAAVTDGTAADFLLLRVAIDSAHAAAARAAERADPAGTASAEPELLVQWSDGTGQWSPGDPVRFKAHAGDLLVPLGAYPRWLLGGHPATVRVSVANPDQVRAWHVDAATFLWLKSM